MAAEPPSAGGAGRCLVLGCQRSGTTLVGMMLEAHHRIEYFGEMNDAVHPLRGDVRALDLEAAAQLSDREGRLLVFAANRETHRAAEIREALPGLRAIWVDRDVRPVVASMVTLAAGDGTWAAVYGVRELEKHLGTDPDVATSALVDRLSTFDDRAREVGTAALVWAVKRRQYRTWSAHLGERLTRVRYEDLVSDTEVVARRIVSWLGCGWDDRVLRHSDHIDHSTIRPGEADPARGVDDSGLAKWRSVLSADDLATIDAVLADDGAVDLDRS